MNFIHSLAKVLITPLIFVMGLAGYSVSPQNVSLAPTQSLGASNPIETPIALFHTSLANAISSSATSMTFVSGTTLDGTTLASSTYSFVIDSGQSNQEFVTADCTNTSCTNMQRGLSVVTGTTTIASLAQSHRRTASVDIVDAPLLLKLTSIISGISSFPNKISYTTEPTFTTGTDIVDKTYADFVGSSGCANANTSTRGCVQTSTGLQTASSTATGSSGALLAIPTSLATSTRGNSTGVGNVVATNNDGRIDPSFLDGTGSGNQYTFNATTTVSSAVIATTTITSANIASSSVSVLNIGSGFVNGSITGTIYSTKYNAATTTGMSVHNGGTSTYLFATSSIITIPANIMQASSTITITIGWECAIAIGSSNNCTIGLKDGTGNDIVSAQNVTTNVSSTNYGTAIIQLFNNGSTSSQKYLFYSSNNASTGGTASLNTGNSFTLNLILGAFSTSGGSNDATAYIKDASVTVNP